MIKPSAALLFATCVLVGIGMVVWLSVQFSRSQSFESTQTQQVGDLQVTMQIDDAAVGTRIIDLQVRDAANQPVDLRSVRVRISMSDMDMGTTEAEASALSSGHYQVSGAPFSMVGAWNVETTLVHADMTATQVQFDIAIAAPGELAGAINPLRGDAQAIVAGQQLYRTNCAACHGQNGQGDGPSAAGLKPRPADFSQHMLPGKHTDGQVFLWIADGYSGSAMPAWRERLSEQEIWQLVSYLRTFGQPEAVPLATFAPVEAAPMKPRPTYPPEPTLTPLPQTNEQLPPMVFVRGGNIWQSDGAGQTNALTELGDEAYAQYPTYSPDGTRIAYIAISPAPITATVPLPTSALYVMNADGSHATQVWSPPQGLLSLPSWSQDSSAIYLAANSIDDQQAESGTDGLQVVRLELADLSTTTIVSGALDPTVSHDGSQIAYLKLAPDGYSMDIRVASPDGTNDRRVLSGADFQGFYAPRFSPDGSTIYVSAIGGPSSDENATSQSPSVVEMLLGLLGPSTAQAHGLPWDVWAVGTDGTGLRRLTNIYEDLPMVAVSSDGQQIIVMGYNGVYLMSQDGSNLRQISDAGDHGGLDWQP